MKKAIWDTFGRTSKDSWVPLTEQMHYENF